MNVVIHNQEEQAMTIMALNLPPFQPTMVTMWYAALQKAHDIEIKPETRV